MTSGQGRFCTNPALGVGLEPYETAFQGAAVFRWSAIFRRLQLHALGHQIVAEFYQCNSALLDDVEYIAKAMFDSAQVAGATIITQTFHHFSPYGVSGAVIIAESHLAIHTWPEYGYAAVDLFTCGSSVSSEKAFDYLKKALEAEHVSTVELRRGLLPFLQKELKVVSAS